MIREGRPKGGQTILANDFFNTAFYETCFRLTVEDVVQMLQLEPHPCEGGFFRETYRSRLGIAASCIAE